MTSERRRAVRDSGRSRRSTPAPASLPPIANSRCSAVWSHSFYVRCGELRVRAGLSTDAPADSISAVSFQNKFLVTNKMAFFFLKKKYVVYNNVFTWVNIFLTVFVSSILKYSRCLFHRQGTVYAFSVKSTRPQSV